MNEEDGPTEALHPQPIAAVLNFVLEEVRAVRSEVSGLRRETRVDHAAVIAKVEELTSEVRQARSAAATAHRLGEANALDIEKLQRRATEEDEVFLAAGGLRRFVVRVLHLADEHDTAQRIEQGIKAERARWLAVPLRMIDEAPKLLILVAALSFTGLGLVISQLAEVLF